MSDLFILDHNCPECTVLNLREHIKASLGEPLVLPPTLADRLSANWAKECEDDLLALFALITGFTYEEVWRENTYNQDTDLDRYAVITVYADTGCPDWCWRRDVFVIVESGMGGDPRYSAYGPAEVYRLEDCCIGDTNFLDWKLSWWAEPINADYDETLLATFNEHASAGYSSHPYGEVERSVYAPPIWSDSRKGYLARLKGIPFPVILRPQPPFYS